MRSNTGRIALCGVLSGFSVAVMLLSSIDIGMTYALPMIAGMVLIVPVLEFGTRTAVTTYASTALLSLILPANKESALMYLFLFGLYPVLKRYFDRIEKRSLRILVKACYFNAAAIAAVGLASWVFQIPIDDGTLGKYAVPLLLAAGNLAFIVYDIAISRCVAVYLYKLQPILRKTFHLN